MLQSKKSMGFVYNPTNQSDQELRDRFVIRLKEFKRIIRELKRSTTNIASQNYLLEGQRGTGKTSMLLRIQSEVLSHPDLAHLLPVRFAEEQYGIFNLCGLWEKVAEELEDTEGFESLLESLEEHVEASDYEQQCFDTLEHYLVKQNKKLLLLIDNFGDLLDKLSLTEQQRLRDIFHNSTHIQLIAASATVLEHTYQHDKPFYEFFKTVSLSGLDKEDTYVLLRKLAEVYGAEEKINDIIENQQYRIESIRRLTGGVPRTIVLLYEIFMDDSGSVFEDLENVLDQVTPLYKHRMDDLSTQQQVIVNALALNWDGMSTKELVQKINDENFSSKKISSQLQLLQKNGVVLAKALDKKNKLYFLRERFFNIWYLMRYGRKKNKQNVRWLVSFLKEWCSTEELHQRARRHIEAAQTGHLHPKSYLMAESIGSLIREEDLQHELIIKTREALKSEFKDIDEILSPSDKEIFEEADIAYKNSQFGKVISILKPLAEKGYASAMYKLAFLYKSEYKDFDQAIHYYQQAIEQGHAGAMNNLALLYASEYKDFDQAIHYYQQAIERGHASAMYNLALLYASEYKDFDQAIHYYQQAIERGHASAMYNLALLYTSEYKDFDQAIHYFQQAIEQGDVDAMYNLALLYTFEYKDFDQAIHYYQQAIEQGGVKAMNNLALLYYVQGKQSLESLELAQKAYALDKDPEIIHTLASVLLWNSKFSESIEKVREYLNIPDHYLNWLDDVGDYFILLLAKKQANAAYQLFVDFPDLKDQIKPIYYATLSLLKEKYPKEYLKMGSELEETVDEVLQKVKEKAELYA
jgi:TPR repeat protein